MNQRDLFVDYKDRSTIVKMQDPLQEDTGIENAASGLIIRKRKAIGKEKVSAVKDSVGDSEQAVSSGFKAEDAVALLLKHSRGYPASDEEDRPLSGSVQPENQKRKDGKKARRVLGPERPSFINEEPDDTTWVPPEGQSGDGRTSLNDRFGY